MIDIRCRHTDLARTTAGGRCQLAVGHEGPHALLFCRDGERTVRTWSPLGPGAEQPALAEMRPWARGYPVVAWIEETPAPRAGGIALVS